MHPDRAAVHQQRAGRPQRVDQLRGRGGGEADQVDDHVGAQRGDPVAEDPGGVLGVPVDGDPADRRPLRAVVVGLAGTAAQRDHLMTGPDQARDQVTADVARGSDDDDAAHPSNFLSWCRLVTAAARRPRPGGPRVSGSSPDSRPGFVDRRCRAALAWPPYPASCWHFVMPAGLRPGPAAAPGAAPGHARLDLATFRSLRPRPRPGQQPAPDRRRAGSVVRSDGPGRTQIAVDLTRPLGSLDRNVFGGFIEHVGRCIYGGVYDEGSPLSDASGFRTDVLALLRELRLGVLRWPGGNFASNYHWPDGVGPAGCPAAPHRPGLEPGGVQPLRHRRVPGLLRRARHRARSSA